MSNKSWQCGGCNTWYAPHVNKCECNKITSGNVYTSGNPVQPLISKSPQPLPAGTMQEIKAMMQLFENDK